MGIIAIVYEGEGGMWYLGEDERDEELDELEVVASFLFLLFADCFLLAASWLEVFRDSILEVCLSPALPAPPPVKASLPPPPPLPVALFPFEKLVLFDLLIFILRLGDSGCCKSDEKFAWPSWSIELWSWGCCGGCPWLFGPMPPPAGECGPGAV